MPANLPPEYFKAEERYQEAKTNGEKIRALQEMISVIPKHKGTNSLIGDIKAKISKIKRQMQKELKKKKAFAKKGIRKEGAAQVLLIGFPNSGKSYILNKLCKTNLASTRLPFETTKAEIGMLNVGGVQIQLIEIPSIYPGFYEKRGEFRSLINTSDALCFVINNKKELELIKKEITIEKPFTFCNSKELDDIGAGIWNILGIIKVYTKEPGKKAEKTPIALKKDSTIELLGNKIHKDFIKKFKYARVFRKKGKIKSRQVGLKFKLMDNDIVEFHTK